MKYYVCETNSRSGIARYAEDFYECVMEKKGYVLVDPVSITPAFLEGCSGEESFFIELGAGQYAEKKALLLIIKHGFFNVCVALHDPPFLTFPYFKFNSPLLNRISRGVDFYFNTFGVTRSVLQRCKTIYVLSRRGEKLLQDRFGALNTKYIPHVVSSKKLSTKPLTGNEKNIMFFGFIGRAKGLDHALHLHSLIVRDYPEVEMHVVGEAEGHSARAYLDRLKARYKYKVHYHGYVPEERLDELFANIAHVFLPSNEYKYVCPASGAIIGALRRGKIVWANPVNSVPELVHDGVNGVFFRNDLEDNVRIFKNFSESPELVEKISRQALVSLQIISDGRSYHCIG